MSWETAGHCDSSSPEHPWWRSVFQVKYLFFDCICCLKVFLELFPCGPWLLGYSSDCTSASMVGNLAWSSSACLVHGGVKFLLLADNGPSGAYWQIQKFWNTSVIPLTCFAAVRLGLGRTPRFYPSCFLCNIFVTHCGTCHDIWQDRVLTAYDIFTHIRKWVFKEPSTERFLTQPKMVLCPKLFLNPAF